MRSLWPDVGRRMIDEPRTWDENDLLAMYSLTRRIFLKRGMTCLEMYRAVQDLLDTVDGIWWDNPLMRHTDELFQWTGEPYEFVGPGWLTDGSIMFAPGTCGEVLMFPASEPRSWSAWS